MVAWSRVLVLVAELLGHGHELGGGLGAELCPDGLPAVTPLIPESDGPLDPGAMDCAGRPLSRCQGRSGT